MGKGEKQPTYYSLLGIDRPDAWIDAAHDKVSELNRNHAEIFDNVYRQFLSEYHPQIFQLTNVSMSARQAVMEVCNVFLTIGYLLGKLAAEDVQALEKLMKEE